VTSKNLKLRAGFGNEQKDFSTANYSDITDGKDACSMIGDKRGANRYNKKSAEC
jgi:hypothetical protein